MYSTYEILEKALEKERQAYDFYENLATDCPNEELRDLLEMLRDEENKHIHLVETMLTRIQLGHEPIQT